MTRPSEISSFNEHLPTSQLSRTESTIGTANISGMDPSRRAALKFALAGVVGACIAEPARLFAAEQSSLREEPRRTRFGLNYIPRKNWWYIWQDWDAQSIAEDFSAIANLGMDHIRIQCLWNYFQPGISFVSPCALERLHQMLDMADAAGLDVEVTVLNGWLSGFAFMPPWVNPLSPERKWNVFTDSGVIVAEKLLFKSIADAIGKHKRFLGFDVGNEINSLLSFGNEATGEQLDSWTTTMLDYCNVIAPGKFHVNGVSGDPWFDKSSFTRNNLSTTGSATVLHCYSYWSGALKRYKYNDIGNLHLLEYQIELAKAYQTDMRRLVWIEEVGTSAEWMPSDYMPEYTAELLRNGATCGNIWGYTWWGSHDIDPALKGFASLEYSLGALDVKNRVKPVGRVLAQLADEMRRRPPEQIHRNIALVIPDHGFAANGGEPMWQVVKQFMDMIASGVRPALVLESRAKDWQYLQARGVDDLVKLKSV